MDDTLVAYGILLISLALALFAAESFVPSYGVLSLAGVTALGAGVWLLAEAGVDRGVWTAAAAIGAGLFVFALLAAWKAGLAHRLPASVGIEHLVGMNGEVRAALEPTGWVMVDGALWRATANTPVAAGERIRVIAVEPEMTLLVESHALDSTTRPGPIVSL